MNKNILLDIPSSELLFDFDKIKESIIQLLEEREPRYTIGIYGDWGSGKTTLLKSIHQDIDKNKDKNTNALCIPVWFNPWRYENEEHIVIPLLLQIQQTLSKALDKSNRYNDEKKDFQDKFSKTARALITGFSGKLSLGVAELSFSGKDAVGQEEEIKQSEIEFISDMSSIYFDIVKNLKDLTCIGEVEIKYFIFIDDLDRCLPDKGLKLLEHIKTLFDTKGFVFIIGLDTRSIKAWIKRKYGADSFISSKDYVEKLIQIPILLPKIRPIEFIDAIKQKKLLNETEINALYEINEHLPQNVRSLKKICNDYLFIKDLNEDVKPDVIFKMLILRHRWERCYNDIMGFGNEILKEIVKFVKESTENDHYKRDRILFCLRNKNYPSGFSFNTFQPELDEQTRFESGFFYFGYFKDYVFDPHFMKYIKNIFFSFGTEEMEEFFKDIPRTCMLNYVEDFQSRWE